MLPAPFMCPGCETRDWRFGDDMKCRALTHMLSRTFDSVEQVRATRTREFTFGTVHKAVEDKCIVPTKKLGHLHLLRHAIVANPFENVIFWDLATKRQGAALGSHCFDLFSECNLFIQTQTVARTVSDLAKPDATFVFDTGLNTLWSGNWIRQSGSQRIIGSFNNASVGTAMAQANGIQALDRTRQVIVLTGDAGFNMLMGEFMTAVHHKLPIKVVIFNNSALGLITLEAESVGILPFREAIEFPNPDFAALARACGGHGFTVKHPGVLRPELNEAFALDGPAIIDCVVPANEMPNMPHIELDQIGNYTVAKIKEAIHAVTGG
jgi:hypothetical protein